MKIAAIEYYPTSTKGGSEKAFFEVLICLKNLGHEITVFYVIKGDLLLEYDKLEIKHMQLSQTEIQYFNFKSWFRIVKSAKLINSVKPDVIYINQLADSVLASVCKLLFKVPIVCHIRVPKMGHSRLFNLSGRLVNYFICVNHLIKNQYGNDFDENKLKVINDGIKIPSTETLGKIKSTKAYTAGYLGRISPEKGLTQLLDAWQVLTEKYNLKIRLDITGPADSNAEKAYKIALAKDIEHRGLSDLVDIKDPVFNPIHYFRRYDFSVFPSIIDESFGRTIPESILAGTPVFARAVGIVNEILAPAKRTLVYKADQELAEKIAHFYHSDLQFNMETLQKHIIQNYDITKNVLTIEAILKNTIPIKLSQ